MLSTSRILCCFFLLFLWGWSGGGGGGLLIFVVVSFCLFSFLFVFVSFCLVCLFSVVCQLFSIGGICKFIIIPFVTGQVPFYNKTF